MPNRIHLAAVAAVFLVLPGLAGAATTPAPDPGETQCRQALATLAPPDLVGAIDKVQATGLGGARCRFSDLTFDASGKTVFQIQDLDVDFGDFTALHPQTPPQHLKATARGVRILPNVPDPLTRYYLAHATHPFELRLDYEVDAAAKRLILNTFTLSSSRLGRFSVSAEIDGVDLSEPPVVDRVVATAALGRLRIEFVNRQMIQSMLLMPLLTQLPEAQNDPELAIPAFKTAATAEIALDSSLDAESKRALSAFIAAFPDDQGSLTMTMAPKTPVPLAQMLQAAQGEDEQRRAIAKALNLSVSYLDLTWFNNLLDLL